mgnify:CR=1 FL=1
MPALLAACDDLAIGTTVATNAILEGKAAKTGLICTAGFRDTLLIREGGKADTYNIFVDYPEPYVPRHLTFGVAERVNAEGGVETPLEESIRLFEEGMRLSELCRKRLDEADRKIELLLRKPGGVGRETAEEGDLLGKEE